MGLVIYFSSVDYVIVRVHLSVSSRLRALMARARNESPCRLNGEDTEQMYSKHLSVYSIFRQTAQYFIYTAIFPFAGILAVFKFSKYLIGRHKGQTLNI